MSDELDENDITNAMLAIIHGIDQSKSNAGWSYNPAWLSAEDNKDSKVSADLPAKSFNVAASDDVSPTSSSPPPVTNRPAQNLPPSETPDPLSTANTSSVNSTPVNSTPAVLPSADVLDSSSTPKVPAPIRALDSLPVPNVPQVKSPLAQISDSPPLPNVPPVSSTSAEVLDLPNVQPVIPINSPPAQATGLQAQASQSPVAPDLPLANSPPVSLSTPNIPSVNSPPVTSPSDEVSDSSPILEGPLASSPPVRALDSQPVPNLPPEHSLLVQDVESLLVRASDSPPVSNAPQVTSLPAKVSDLPPLPNVPPVIPINSLPAQSLDLPAQASDSLPNGASDSPVVPNLPLANSPPVPLSTPNIPSVNSPPAALPSAEASESSPIPKAPPASSPPVGALDSHPVPNLPPEHSLLTQDVDSRASDSPPVSIAPQVTSLPPQVSDLPPLPNVPPVIPINSPPAQPSGLPAQALDLLPNGASDSPVVPNLLPENSPPVPLSTPNIPSVNSPQAALPSARVSDSSPIPKVSPGHSLLAQVVNRVPVRDSDSASVPNVPQVSPPPTQTLESPLVPNLPLVKSPSAQVSDLPPLLNAPSVSSASAQALHSPPAPNAQPVLPLNSPLAQASHGPPIQASDSPVAPNVLLANSPPVPLSTPSVPAPLPSAEVSNLSPILMAPPASSSPIRVIDSQPIPNAPLGHSPLPEVAGSQQIQAPCLPPVPNVQPVIPPPAGLPTPVAPSVPPLSSPPVQAPRPLKHSPSYPYFPPVKPRSNRASVTFPISPNTTPAAQGGYFPAGRHFSTSSSPFGANFSGVPQSASDPVGPALSAQVGNKSYEMAEKFRNLARTQSTISSIDVQLQNMGMVEPIVIDFNLTNYLRNPDKYISKEDYSNAYHGAADEILTVIEENSIFDAFTCHCKGKEGKKKAGHKTTMATHVIRLFYFAFQFFYPLILFLIDRDQPIPYIVVCTIFAFIGLLYDGIHVVLEVKEHYKERDKRKQGEQEDVLKLRENDALNSSGVAGIANGLVGSGNIVTMDQDKGDGGKECPGNKKTTTPRKMLKTFVKDMLEEIIIYPSLICNLYGFINERVWEFDNPFKYIDFLLTLISFFVDALFAKLNHIWLLHKLIDSSTRVQKKSGLYSHITPANLLVPFSIGLAISHTLMLALIGVRIYADNFNVQAIRDCNETMVKNNPKSKAGEEGCFYVTAYTIFMIFCGAYLPLMSAACYIILNKFWFLQISWILYNKEKAMKKMDDLHATYMKNIPTKVKMFGFLRDKYAYIAVAVFGPALVAFYVGAFLTDYDARDLPSGAQTAANIIGGLFVFVFSFINLQASITFVVLVALFMIIICVVCIGDGSADNLRNKFVRRSN